MYTEHELCEELCYKQFVQTFFFSSNYLASPVRITVGLCGAKYLGCYLKCPLVLSNCGHSVYVSHQDNVKPSSIKLHEYLFFSCYKSVKGQRDMERPVVTFLQLFFPKAENIWLQKVKK